MSIVNQMGPKRGNFEEGDRVMVETAFGEPPEQGQVVAQTPDGKVRVAALNGLAEMEVEPHQIWRDTEPSVESIESKDLRNER